MANIYDMAGAIQQPNAIGNFNQGVQIGQQNQVYGQKQAAYQQALGDQQNIRALAPQVIAGDPGAFSQVAAIDPSQAQNLQSAGDAQLRRLSGAIQYLDSQKDPQAKEAAYQQSVKPYLAQLGQATGKVPPATFAEAEPMMEAARAKIASFSASQPSDLATIGAGGAVYDKTHQRVLYQNPGVPRPATMVTIHTPNGDQQAMLNPDGTLSALKIGGQPGAPSQVNTQLTPNPNAQSVAADQATALVSTGMDPGQAAAMAMAQHPGTTLAFDAGSKSFRDVSNGSEMIPATAAAAPPVTAGVQAATPSNGQPAAAQGSPMPSGSVPGGQGVQVPPQAPNAAGAPQGQSGMQVPHGAPSPLALPGGIGLSPPKSAAGDSFHTATAAEIAAAGLPKGTSAQVNDKTKQIHVLNKGDGDGGLSDDAANLLATAAQQGYKIPIPSLGMKSNGDRDKYLNKLADNIKVTGIDVPTAIRNMVYGESGIFATKAMQKNYGVTMQNEMSAQNQATIALDASQKMQRGDIQALNQWWLTGKKQFGSVEAQNYANAINTFAEEYAKVMSGANGAAAATDSSRAKAHEMINAGLSQGQMDGVVALMKQEMRGRTQGQLDAIQAQVKGLRDFGDDGTGQHETPTMDQTPINAPGQQPQQAAPQVQPRAVNSMGHAVVWNGSAWVPE